MGERARVMVYGSRLNDQRRGGDLDLLVLTEQPMSLLARAELKLALEERLQLPVDVLNYQPGTEPSPFQSIALVQAVALEQAA